MKLLLIALLLLLSACSSKPPTNMWQYKTHSSYKSFERYYLEYKLDLAAIELKRAREYASQSADLSTLAQLELSVCALQVALLEPFRCEKFERLEKLIDSDALMAYKHFLDNTLSVKEVELLPEQYRDFARSKLNDATETMQEELQDITPLTSKMIAASLIKNRLHSSTRKMIRDDISYHGYTYGSITWLNFEINVTKNEAKKRKLKEVLDVIYSYREK